MLLMDSIIQTADMAVAEGLERHILFQEYMRLAKLLNPPQNKNWNEPFPPRFVFDQKAIRTATELTLGRPKVQRDVLRYLRVPYPDMWVEWEDAGREELRRKFSHVNKELAELRPFPTRMGFFIEAEEGGRKGTITWAWSREKEAPIPGFEFLGKIPNVSSIRCEFDLDGDYPIDYFEKYPLSLAALWEGNQIQSDALYDIWRTCRHYETEVAYMTHRGDKLMRALLFADVVGEYIVAWACLFLLTATRKAVDIREVDMSRLNKARAKSKKPSLLNHRTVHIHVGETTQKTMVARGPLGYERKSPHIHLVSSYAWHRGEHHGIVIPYWRGSGPPIPKTIHVHG